MTVINQDVALNALETMLVATVPDTPINALSHPGFQVTQRQVVDAGTSYALMIYDLFDIPGEFIPNSVSFGVSFQNEDEFLGFYILVYR